MFRRNQRFHNQLDDHLIHLHKNLFISHADPLYYEKVIRYLDAHSPEAHYKLGQKFHVKGNWKKAHFHYKEVLRTYPSPFYSAANRAIHQLELQQAAHFASLEQTISSVRKPLLPPFMKVLLVVLLLINVVLVLLFAGDHAIYRTISKMKVWGVGSEVTYETMDKPFILYLTPDADRSEIEKSLHKQALVLAKEMPKANIMIYGIVSQDPRDKGKTMVLTNDDMVNQAIAIATYQPDTDAMVHIRYLNAEFKEHQPLSAIGANLVRTALAAYQKDVGHTPQQLTELLQDYPNNYLSVLPVEAVSGSNKVAEVYDGGGGWVYDPQANELTAMFYANTAGVVVAPYDPIHIEVNKAEHEVKLLSGPYLLWDKPIGLGANGSTPEGQFRVVDRVQQPKGKTSQSYGDAGLGLGNIALHGTYDASSIGSDKSLGCIRLTNEDIQEVFPFVPKGAEVQILSSSIESHNVEAVERMPSLLPANKPPHTESSDKTTFHWLG